MGRAPPPATDLPIQQPSPLHTLRKTWFAFLYISQHSHQAHGLWRHGAGTETCEMVASWLSR